MANPGGISSTGERKPRHIELAIGSDVEIAKHLADDDMREVVKCEGEFWRYADTHWEPIPAHKMSQHVHQYDGAWAGNRMVKLSHGRVEGILFELGNILEQPDFFRKRPEGINCEAGFIVFDEDGSPSLENHSPDHRQQHVLRGRWELGAGDGQRVRACLGRNFQGDEDADRKLDLLEEVAGVAALGRGGQKDSKAIIFLGPTAGNGKSTILDLISAGLPESARTALPPAKFKDDHHAVLLRGKLLNAVAELGTAGVIASEAFKKAITGDEFTARDLYKSSFTFRPRAQHIFATNAMPSFQGGIDLGVSRRLLILEFNRTIPAEERDGTLERLPTEHAEEFLAWLVDGASRYVRQGGFTLPASSKTALSEWAKQADPVLGWIAERVSPVHATDDKCTSREAYNDFAIYCRAELCMHDRDIPRLRTFIDRCKGALKARGKISHGHSGDFRGFFGMRLREPTDAMKADDAYQPGFVRKAGAYG